MIMRLGALLGGFSDTRERRMMVSRLELQPGQRALEVSVGTGTNLPFMVEAVGAAGPLVGLDLSRGMLRQCEKKVRRQGLAACLIEGEAAHLPFSDDAFDAVLHFGGINEFGDKKGAVEEMARVAKSGAKIVIADEGVNPNKPPSFRNRLLLRLNPLYEHDPPTDLIPSEAKNLRVTWFRADRCYLIDFANP